MSAPFKLQLALQGGGAKIVHLVAALEVMQKLQADRRIQVTRIAGTSAGAIAGSLFAADISMSVVKDELRKFRRHLDDFRRPTKFEFLKTVVWKEQALADTRELEALLKRLFATTSTEVVRDTSAAKNGHAGPVMLIVSADIYTGKSHVAQEDESIVTALLDSCAIPFYFRVWKHPRGAFVDGGICENLPSEQLRKDQEKYGPILAISFSRPALPNPANWTDYAKALLDTTIHNSVARSIQHLSPEHVLRIPSEDLGTFDFVGALSEKGLGSIYDATRRLTEKFFDNFLSSAASKTVVSKTVAPILGDMWASHDTEIMRKLGAYAATLNKAKYKVKSVSYMVEANCLLKEGEPFFGAPDVATLKVVVYTGDEPVYAHKFSMTVSPASGFRGQADLHIIGPPYHESDITPTLFPVIEPEHLATVQALEKDAKEQNIREVLAFLSPPLAPHSGPFTLIFREILSNSMAPLKNSGRDQLWISKLLRADGFIEQMDLVLIIPDSFGGVSMVEHEKSKNLGARASGREINEYTEKTPNGFRPLVWRCKNADPSQFFAVNVVKYS